METTISNPYGYLDKAEFTSELYKIEIKNLHAKVGFSQLKQRLKSIGLKPHKVKIMKDYSFVTFNSAEERDEAITKVTGHTWKGNILFAKIAKARADPYLKRKEMEEVDKAVDSKKIKVEDDKSEEEKLKDHVVKFWRKPYENQLIAKENKIQGILQNLYSKLNKENHLIKSYKNYFSQIDDKDVACPVMPIVESPIERDYRNKCEFTIGWTLDKQGPVMGFCHGKYRGGFDAVGDARCLPIIHPRMRPVLDCINELLPRLVSGDVCIGSGIPLAVFSPGTDEGHLRGITLRTGDMNLDEGIIGGASLTMIIDIHPQSLADHELQAICDFFADFFTNGQGKSCRPTSLLLTTRRNNSDPLDLSTTKIIFGSGFVYERLMELDFRISFNAFFQVNTLAADTLYCSIRQLLRDYVLQSDVEKRVTLLDICCGTGTIGLAMAGFVHEVIGVEMCAESVEDANYNAKLNKITNARFLVGKAEDLLANLLILEERNQSDSEREFVAIVDPPRAGLHGNVIQALRRCELIRHVIFVSCNPEAAYRNFVDFARPISKRTHGCPFIPKVSIPVDLFPQTPHVELIMLLTRLTPN